MEFKYTLPKSSSIITTHHLRGISPLCQPWRKVSCFALLLWFRQVGKDFARIASLEFAWELQRFLVLVSISIEHISLFRGYYILLPIFEHIRRSVRIIRIQLFIIICDNLSCWFGFFFSRVQARTRNQVAKDRLIPFKPISSWTVIQVICA